MVEDQYARCSSAVIIESERWFAFNKRHLRHLRILEQLLGLRVIVGLDLVVILEVLLDALVRIYLEAVAVESITIFVSADIVDGHLLSDMRPVVSLGLAVTDMS